MSLLKLFQGNEKEKKKKEKQIGKRKKNKAAMNSPSVNFTKFKATKGFLLSLGLEFFFLS